MLDTDALLPDDLTCRYSENLQTVINDLKGVRVLRLDFDADYQGYVDIDIELEDGRIFSYYYAYGSCSGCDVWENKEYTDKQIEDEMKQEATYYDNMDQYNEWRKRVLEESKKRGR